MPLAIEIVIRVQLENVAFVAFVRLDTPCVIRMTPAANRNSSKPKPGAPQGNVENNLCSWYLLSTTSVNAEGHNFVN